MEINILDSLEFSGLYDTEHDHLDPYAKSVMDQLTLVKQRMYEIDNGIISIEDEAEEFILGFVSLGDKRNNININDTYTPDFSFKNLIKLRRQVEDLIPCNYLPVVSKYLFMLLESTKI